MQKSDNKSMIEVDGVKRPMFNSNDQLIHSTDDGIRNFWKWFGNSKAIDFKGRPLVVYHGTKSDFNSFEIGRKAKNSCVFGEYEDERMGLFFTSDKNFAGHFKGDDGKIIAAYLNVQKQADLTEGFDDELYTSIRDVLSDNNLLRTYPDEMWELFDKGFPGATEFVDAVKQKGYDGAATIERDDDSNAVDVFVVFSPNQIKSATDNSGDFNPDSLDICDVRVLVSSEDSIGGYIEIDGAKRPVFSSNGTLIHPTEEGVRNFWKWFGDSKAVDDQGRPLVVYHGTDKNFTEFDSSLWRQDHGIYLTTDSEYASGYANSFMSDGIVMPGANVMPMFVKISSPEFYLTKSDQFDVNMVNILEKSGIDGAFVGITDYEVEVGAKTVAMSHEIVVFRPNQIKSATGNSGDFNPDSGDVCDARCLIANEDVMDEYAENEVSYSMYMS